MRYALLTLLLLLGLNIFAQTPDSLQTPPKFLADTAKAVTDTLKKDKGEMDTEVKYTAEDSIIMVKDSNIVYMYGQARIKYGDFELDADYIRLNNNNNTLFAKGRTEAKSNKYRGRPIFKQGH